MLTGCAMVAAAAAAAAAVVVTVVVVVVVADWAYLLQRGHILHPVVLGLLLHLPN